MTPKMLLGIVPFKSFDDLTANKAFHQLLCCLHDEKICSSFPLEGSSSLLPVLTSFSKTLPIVRGLNYYVLRKIKF